MDGWLLFFIIFSSIYIGYLIGLLTAIYCTQGE